MYNIMNIPPPSYIGYLVDEKVAVILRGRELIYPLMIIKYKNMYEKKK